MNSPQWWFVTWLFGYLVALLVGYGLVCLCFASRYSYASGEEEGKLNPRLLLHVHE
jgi:hypothetical protein